MILERLDTGMFQSNCYIAGDNGEGVIIDCGVSTEEIVRLVKRTGLDIKYIILTHAHIDHICELDKTRDNLNAKVAVHENEESALMDSFLNASALLGSNQSLRKADILLKDGDVLEVGGLEFKTIHTPGHTRGGICVKSENHIFTGDTLFKMSVGRTDLPGGNQRELIDSIRKIFSSIPDEFVVYPGHGSETTIGYEKTNNPFIR